MPNKSRLLTAFLSLFVSTFVFGQTYPGNPVDFSVLLKADSNSRSVLLSNVLKDQPGNKSPIIGAAGWIEEGKQLQCRSLLFFNYGQLPKTMRADMIKKAELILIPVRVNNSSDNNNHQASNFIIQRVLEPWADTLATWIHQPLADDKDKVARQVNPNKKDKPVKIDVTQIVKNMFRYGNNGFMIRYKDSLDQSTALSHWFASTKYENKDLRPLLLITFGFESNVLSTDMIPPLPMTARDRNEMMQNYFRPEPVIATPPAEVKVPEKTKENN